MQMRTTRRVSLFLCSSLSEIRRKSFRQMFIKPRPFSLFKKEWLLGLNITSLQIFYVQYITNNDVLFTFFSFYWYIFYPKKKKLYFPRSSSERQTVNSQLFFLFLFCFAFVLYVVSFSLLPSCFNYKLNYACIIRHY